MTADFGAIDLSREGTVLVRVHLQPRAARNRFCGLHGDALKLAVTAPPVDGKANREVLAFLAELLAVSGGDVELVSGARSRRKCFSVANLSPEEVEKRVRRLLDGI